MKKYGLFFSSLLFAGIANATLIDFEGVSPPSTQFDVGNNYIEEGFNFFNPGNAADAAIIGQVSQNTTGSDYYTWNSLTGNNPVTLTNLLGGSFDLFSLDVGTKINSLGSFDITGFFTTGGSVVHNVINASAFTSTQLNWSNLAKVEFSYVSGDFGAIDNLSIDTTQVPEPTTLVLLGLGLAGLGFSRKRNTT